MLWEQLHKTRPFGRLQGKSGYDMMSQGDDCPSIERLVLRAKIIQSIAE